MQYLFRRVKGPYDCIRPCCVGLQQCKPGPVFGPGHQSMMVFQYVLKGSGVYRCSYGTYIMEAGDIFLIHPGDTVEYVADQNDPWKYCWISFSLKGELSDCFKTGKLHNESVKPIFDELLNATTITHGQTAFATACIYRLIAALETETTYEEVSPLIRYAKEIIDREYAKGITVEDLAKRLHMNRSYLCERMRLEINSTPQHLITMRRMHEACRLLQNTQLPIGEIALLAGYKNAAQFSRYFKRHYSFTPSFYRKNHSLFAVGHLSSDDTKESE